MANLEAAGKCFGDLAQRRQAALVALDGDHALGTMGQKRAGQPAGTGADLDGRAGAELAGRPRDAAGQVEIEQEMLPQGTAGIEAVARDHLAQGREPVAGAQSAALRMSMTAARRRSRR